MISLANFVGLPTKVTWPTAFFLKKKSIFVQLSCVGRWPVDLRVSTWIAASELNIYFEI